MSTPTNKLARTAKPYTPNIASAEALGLAMQARLRCVATVACCIANPNAQARPLPSFPPYALPKVARAKRLSQVIRAGSGRGAHGEALYSGY